MENVGFIGLGLMGQPMAANLVKAGYRVTVYNRSADKARVLVEQGATLARRPQDVIASEDGIVFTMVGDDHALEEVTIAKEGISERLGKNGVHVCMATVWPGMRSAAPTTSPRRYSDGRRRQRPRNCGFYALAPRPRRSACSRCYRPWG